MLVMAARWSGIGVPDGRFTVSSHHVTRALHQAVFRFDTRIIFSCEEFARDRVRRPWVSMTLPNEDQWQRIKVDARVLRSSVRASPDCLVQAGLMVI